MMKSQKNPGTKSSKKRVHRGTPSDRRPTVANSFDRESGLVYNEVEIARPKSFSHGWISDFATPNLVRTKRRPNDEAGARTLHAMILQKLGIESQDLTVEAIQYIPWTVGRLIWDSICAK